MDTYIKIPAAKGKTAKETAMAISAKLLLLIRGEYRPRDTVQHLLEVITKGEEAVIIARGDVQVRHIGKVNELLKEYVVAAEERGEIGGKLKAKQVYKLEEVVPKDYEVRSKKEMEDDGWLVDDSKEEKEPPKGREPKAK